jgi:hypothetical protein
MFQRVWHNLIFSWISLKSQGIMILIALTTLLLITNAILALIVAGKQVKASKKGTGISLNLSSSGFLNKFTHSQPIDSSPTSSNTRLQYIHKERKYLASKRQTIVDTKLYEHLDFLQKLRYDLNSRPASDDLSKFQKTLDELISSQIERSSLLRRKPKLNRKAREGFKNAGRRAFSVPPRIDE